MVSIRYRSGEVPASLSKLTSISSAMRLRRPADTVRKIQPLPHVMAPAYLTRRAGIAHEASRGNVGNHFSATVRVRSISIELGVRPINKTVLRSESRTARSHELAYLDLREATEYRWCVNHGKPWECFIYNNSRGYHVVM